MKRIDRKGCIIYILSNVQIKIKIIKENYNRGQSNVNEFNRINQKGILKTIISGSRV